jgi:glucan biosynthesis protein C
MLFRGRRGLQRLTSWWSWRTPALALPVLAACYLVALAHGADTRIGHAARCVFSGFSIWSLVLASFGVFLKYAARERLVMRYLSDSAYWSYIIHLPVVLFVVGVLAPVALPAIVKSIIVLTITTVVCLVTYHAFVRRTFIGRWLNGSRPVSP